MFHQKLNTEWLKKRRLQFVASILNTGPSQGVLRLTDSLSSLNWLYIARLSMRPLPDLRSTINLFDRFIEEPGLQITASYINVSKLNIIKYAFILLNLYEWLLLLLMITNWNRKYNILFNITICMWRLFLFMKWFCLIVYVLIVAYACAFF